MAGIWQGMGFAGDFPNPDIALKVEKVLDYVRAIARPSYSCRLVRVDRCAGRKVVLEGVPFEMGSVIAPFFREATMVAVFVATVGSEFDKWLHSCKVSEDILDQFIADATGSVLAEGVVERMAADIDVWQTPMGNRTGNSYSPGYCGWNITEQRNLFSLLPEDTRGVTLNGSCLMDPIKSVSGMIPIGPRVEKHAYGCAICDRRGCFRNRDKR